MKKNNKKKGFTLVELLVVIAILAILASVTVVGYLGFTDKARQSVADQEAKQAETAIFASLLEGEYVWVDKTDISNYRTYTYKYNNVSGMITVETALTGTQALKDTVDAQIKLAFDLSELTGEFTKGEGDALVYTAENGKAANVGAFKITPAAA